MNDSKWYYYAGTLANVRHARHARMVSGQISRWLGVLEALVSAAGAVHLEFDREETTLEQIFEKLKENQTPAVVNGVRNAEEIGIPLTLNQPLEEIKNRPRDPLRTHRLSTVTKHTHSRKGTGTSSNTVVFSGLIRN